MDFRICNQQTAEKENFGVHQVLQNGEPRNVVSILKTSQRTNLPLEKKLTKVSLSVLKFRVSNKLKCCFSQSFLLGNMIK